MIYIDLIGSMYEAVRVLNSIDKSTLAKILEVPEHLIVSVECWAYCVFVHRRDRGGQFVSYRRMRQWLHIIFSRIKTCPNWKQLHELWLALEEDYQNFSKQYEKNFLDRILNEAWLERWKILVKDHPIMAKVY